MGWSRGSRFYCPSHTTRVIESDRATYFEEDTDTSQGPREIIFRKERVIIPIPVASAQVYNPLIDQNLKVTHDDPVDQEMHRYGGHRGFVDLRSLVTMLFTYRSISLMLVIPQTHLPIKKPLLVLNPLFWIDGMKDEMSSMSQNEVLDLVDLPNGCRPIGCKWMFKTKRDSRGQVKR